MTINIFKNNTLRLNRNLDPFVEGIDDQEL